MAIKLPRFLRPHRRAGRKLRVLRECPHCGASFTSGLPACPECGSDENTGWKHTREVQRSSVDLGGDEAPARTSGGRLLILAVATLFALVYAFGGCALLAREQPAAAR